MTSPRLPLVNAQRSFLSGIRSSRECHGTQSESNSESYRVSKYKEPREIIRKKLRPREFRTSVFYRWRCYFHSAFFCLKFSLQQIAIHTNTLQLAIDLVLLQQRCQVIFEIAVKLFKVLSSHISAIKKHFEPSTVKIGGTVHKI